MESAAGDQSAFAIHAAAREGKASTVESLLKADAQLATVRDVDGRLPVHWACSANCLAVVALLAEQRASWDPDAQDGSGWSPLMIAASVKDAEPLVQFLLGRGADVNQKNHSGQTALHLVASKNQLEVARTLCGHDPPASARVRDQRGQYALHRAAAVGAGPMVRLLLQHRSPLDAADAAGYTALHHAVAEGHGDTAVELLKAGADPAPKNRDGHTPLQLAPDKEVRNYITREAEREGIVL
ncbi:hypothetical protein P8C59_003377 [Phyllachora maydis]|uniref:26S proteasome non-ATPase regulatory subunit 10 n=1 Tax=Phyllachora maydis TaxID=1825666 RepID=A0AAD9I1C0_9PEZI|nr:hypothetical protein P8C59_003377 [Phyllachora maydis]